MATECARTYADAIVNSVRFWYDHKTNRESYLYRTITNFTKYFSKSPELKKKFFFENKSKIT